MLANIIELIILITNIAHFLHKKPAVYWAVVTSNTLHILLTFHLSGQKSHEINENLSKGSAHVKRELRLSLRTSVWLRKNGTFERALLLIVYTHVPNQLLLLAYNFYSIQFYVSASTCCLFQSSVIEWTWRW